MQKQGVCIASKHLPQIFMNDCAVPKCFHTQPSRRGGFIPLAVGSGLASGSCS